tara:strand:+ start:18 stop:1715 length:1698 start_codon:yes stop_codon:yes gene_type:complete
MAAAPGADMSGLANLMAMKGRKGDNTLVHMSKSELPYLNMLARSAGHPRGLPVNPETGLPEANILKSILPIAGTILGTMFLGPAAAGLFGLGTGSALATGIGAGLGSFGGGLLSGQSLKDAAIGGLLSGGLSGLGAATFGGQSLMGVPETVGQATPEIVTQGVQQAGQQAMSGLPAGQQAVSGLPEAGFGTNFATAGPTNIPADVARNMVTFPEGLAPSAKLFSEAVPLNTINKIQSMPLDPGFTDIGVLNKYDPNLFSSKLDYMKYAAKPAATAGLAGIGVDAALERGAFEPIDYSSYYDAMEVERPSPLPKKGLRFESEKTGAFPTSVEEALAFAQPGAGRRRFFDERFTLPAKTGGLIKMQEGGSFLEQMLTGGLLSTDKAQDVISNLPLPMTSLLGGAGAPALLEKFLGGGGDPTAPPPAARAMDAPVAPSPLPTQGELEEMEDVATMQQVLSGIPVEAQAGGLIQAYEMGGPPSPYFEGRVNGPGDGMSDSIPFSIEGQQPAILSRDEYVLPADIVSMMGNGSSDAGAGKIDSFINDFRVQKYGRGEQPPETSRGLNSIG